MKEQRPGLIISLLDFRKLLVQLVKSRQQFGILNIRARVQLAVSYVHRANPLISAWMEVIKPLAESSKPPQRVVVAFDMGAETFRHKIFAGYKADRTRAPDALRYYQSRPMYVFAMFM